MVIPLHQEASLRRAPHIEAVTSTLHARSLEICITLKQNLINNADSQTHKRIPISEQTTESLCAFHL